MLSLTLEHSPSFSLIVEHFGDRDLLTPSANAAQFLRSEGRDRSLGLRCGSPYLNCQALFEGDDLRTRRAFVPAHSNQLTKLVLADCSNQPAATAGPAATHRNDVWLAGHRVLVRCRRRRQVLAARSDAYEGHLFLLEHVLLRPTRLVSRGRSRAGC